MALKIDKTVHTGKVTEMLKGVGTGESFEGQLPLNPLQLIDKLDQILANPPKAVAPDAWVNFSVIKKIKWYIDAAATSEPPKFPLFAALVADAGMLPVKGTYTPKELGVVFSCKERALLDWREKGLKPRHLPSGPRYFAEDIEKFLMNQ